MIPPSLHQHSASLGSRSGSIPHSSSVASGSYVSSLRSNAPLMSNLSELIGGPSKLSKEDKDMLL